ncbi:MAG: hypothetical protein Q9205_006943 [Flavoplaca limonia]
MYNEGRQWHKRLGNGELPRRWTPRAATESRIGETKLPLVHSEEEKPRPREGFAGSESTVLNANKLLSSITGDSQPPADPATGNGSLSKKTVSISLAEEEGSNPTTQTEVLSKNKSIVSRKTTTKTFQRKAVKEKNVPNVSKVRRDTRESHTRKPETELTPMNMGPSYGATKSVGEPQDKQVASAFRDVGETHRKTGKSHGQLEQVAHVVGCFWIMIILLWLWALEAQDESMDELAGMWMDGVTYLEGLAVKMAGQD